MSRRLKVGVVGSGIGSSHIDAYHELADLYEVAVLCDIDPERASALASAKGIARTVTAFEDLLALDLDIIDICTPPSLHFGQTLQALKAGRHVVVEKPIAGSLAEIDRLAEAEQASAGCLSPVFQYRFGNGIRRFMHLRDKGLVGKPFVATAATHWLRGAAYYSAPWRGRWATELGGCLVSHAIHAHDLVTQVLGPPSVVYARMATRVNPIETEDCVAAVVEMESGALATLSVTLGCQEEISQLKFCFEGLTVESGLDPYNPGYEPWRFIAADPDRQRAIDAAFEDFVPGQQRFVGFFVELHAALTDGGPLPVTIDDSRASIELATAFYSSARSGSAVTLPVGPDNPFFAGLAPETERENG